MTKSIKKLIVLAALIICVLMVFAACGKNNEKTNESITPTAAVTTPGVSPTDNKNTPDSEESATPSEPTPTSEPIPMDDEFLAASEGYILGEAVMLGDNVNSIDGDHIGAGVEWEIDVNIAGTYTVKVYYHTPASATLSVYINGSKQQEKINFVPVEGQWHVFSEDAYTVYKMTLPEGECKVSFIREEDDTNYVALGGISFTYGDIKIDDEKIFSVGELIPAAKGEILGSACILGECVNSLDEEHLNAGVQWTVKSDKDSNVKLRVYYYTPAEKATLSLFVNDNLISNPEFSACENGAWSDYDESCYIECEISLQNGNNIIRFTRTEKDLMYVAIGAIEMSEI